MRLCKWLLLSVVCWPAVVCGQTNNSYPFVLSLNPVAGRIGETREHVLRVRYNLAGATQVLVSGTGVTGEVLPDAKEKPEDKTRTDVTASERTIRFSIAADALPGVRDFRVLTPHGPSTVGQFVLTRDPVIAEVNPNDTREQAQSISLPATVCGAIEKAEDVDYFKFTAQAGECYTFHVRSQRLLDRLHDMQIRIDPLLKLRTASGAVIASNDNYFAGDPLLVHQFAESGEYLLEIRDVRYQGNADWIYAIEINSRPFVTQVFPLAVNPGTETQLELVGFNLAANARLTLPIPAEAQPGLMTVAGMVGDQPTNEFQVYVSGLPVTREADPAPAIAAAAPAGAVPAVAVAEVTPGASVAAATPTTPTAPPQTEVTLPATLTGRISQPYEIDRFVFTAKAQQKWEFQVFARRAGSGLDSYLRVLNDKDAPQLESDDATYHRVLSSDSWVETWTCPVDGRYVLELRDLHQRGGPQFTYAVRVQPAEPYFLLEADTDKTPLTPGLNGVIYVRTLRKQGFTGEIQLGIDGLPPGVTATCGKILSTGQDGCIILQTTPETPLGASNVRIFGTATVPVPDAEPRTLTAEAHILQEYYSPGGGRGNYPVDRHTVAVSEPIMDLRGVKVSTNEVVLKPGTSQRIDITVDRAPGFMGNVTLDVILQHLETPYGTSLPKGVKMDVGASKTLLTAGDSAGYITLIAADDAPAVERQLIPVNAHISINFVVKHTFCSAPITVTVLPK